MAFLLAVFSSHLLLTRKGNFLLNRLFSVQLLSRFGQICIFLFIVSGYNTLFPAFQKIFTPFFCAAPACSYLYVRTFVQGSSTLRRKDLLHFLPALLALVHVLFPSFAGAVNWDAVAGQIQTGGYLSVTEKTGLLPIGWFNTGLSALLLGYLIAAWYVALAPGFIRKSKWEINKIWLFFYLSIVSFFRLLSFAALIVNVSGRNYATNPVFLTICGMVLLFMIVFVLCRPGILYGYVMVSSGTPHHRIQENVPVTKNVSATKSKLTPDQQQVYVEAIGELMEREQPYLLQDFQIIHLAQRLQIPVHHCSTTINNVMGRNFRDWLNSYRIKHFIKVYPGLSDTMTVETVAYESGFKNITTFYNAFKKETGQMPTTYFSLQPG